MVNSDVYLLFEKLNKDQKKEALSFIRSLEIKKTKTDELPIFLFLVVAIVIGIMTKNMEKIAIKMYIGILLLLVTSLYTINKTSINEGLKQKLMLFVLICILIHLSPTIRHDNYNNENPTWENPGNILFNDHTNHITNKFILLMILAIPTILISLLFKQNDTTHANKITKGVILSWILLFFVYIWNIPEGKQQLTSDERQTMYQQFISKYTAFIILFLVILGSQKEYCGPSTQSLAIASVLVILANVTSRILNSTSDDDSENSVLTPSRIPERYQIVITIVLLLIFTRIISKFPLNRYKSLSFLAPIMLLLVNVLIVCFAYIPDLVPTIFLTLIISLIFGFILFFILTLIPVLKRNIKVSFGLCVLLSSVFGYFIYTKMIKDKLNIMVDGQWMGVNEASDKTNLYGTNAGMGNRQIEGLWDIRISDIIDLVLHIVVQFIVLYLIARGLTVVSNSGTESKFNFKDGKINILICLAILLFVGTSLLPILSPLTLLFTAGGTISVGVSAHKQISESFRNIGQKTIESSDVDNFLLSEIKEKLKIMNYIERNKLLITQGGGRRKK